MLAAVAAPADNKQQAGEGTDLITVRAYSNNCSDASSTESAPEAEAAARAAEVLKGGPLNESSLQDAKSAVFNPSVIKNYVGMDVTSLLSVPLFIMEPLTMLQKMAEIMEYTQLLDAADAATDPSERLALVSAFLVSPFGAAERAWKPFNPILGETFEMDNFGNGARFFAEQVSHHPPVSAAHGENKHWSYDIVSAPTTRFLGNSLEVHPRGRTRIQLRSHGETYCHVPPHAKVHNLVLGRTWVDTFGTFTVWEPNTGARCTLEFTPCGWFSSGQYEFSGHVTDAAGKKQLYLSGKWNSHLDCQGVTAGGSPVGSARRLWSCAPKPSGDHYGMTTFARALNSTEHLVAPPLPSDSRRRPDRAGLEKRTMSAAAAAKQHLEDAQRAEQKHRGSLGPAGAYKPRFFEAAPAAGVIDGEESAEEVPLWKWVGPFPAQQQPAAGTSWQGTVNGQGFNPWQFPQLHNQQ